MSDESQRPRSQGDRVESDPEHPLVAHARANAIEAHGSQPYGDHPYRYHLQQVATLVQAYGPEAQAIAWLHDVVEDTKVGIAIIDQAFGPVIAQAVDYVTDPPGATREERKASLHARLAALSAEDSQNPAARLALIVKAADRLANVRENHRSKHQRKFARYQAEHPAFRQAVYRPGLCPEIWTELDELIKAETF